MPLRQKFFFEFEVIFDDPIVHDRDTPRAVPMWMGIALLRDPMRGPACMRNPAGSRRLKARHLFFELGDLTFASDGRQFPVLNRESGGVVPAVLKGPEPFHEDGRSGFAADVTNDSTHIVL